MNNKLIIGIITYFKNGDSELLIQKTKLIPSLKEALNHCDNPENVIVLIYANDDMTVYASVALEKYMRSYDISYRLIGGKKLSTPIARNELLKYCILNYPDTNLWMPDDDDSIFPLSIQAIQKYIEVTDDRYHPTLMAFEDDKGSYRPNNRRPVNDPSTDYYIELGGYINWNMIFNTDYFLNNNLGYPEFMGDCVKSHDTIIDTKNSIIMYNQRWNFLVNPTYNYKLQEGSISTSTPRPDTPMYHLLSYFYNYQSTKRIKNFYYYNPFSNKCQIISNHMYRHLRFDKSDLEITKERIGDRKLLIQIGGSLTTNMKFHSCDIIEGLPVIRFTNGSRFRLSYYGELENLSKYGCGNYLQYLNIPKEDYSNYFFMRIHSLYNLE